MRLELGVVSAAVPLGRYAGAGLGRGDYQALVKANLNTPEVLEVVGDEALLACVGGDPEKARAVRDAAAAIRAEPPISPAVALPDYEP